MKNENLIPDLVKDLKPVKRLPSYETRIFLWLTSSLFIMFMELFIVAHLRPEAFEMLVYSKRFLLETALIVVAPVFAAVGAVFLSVPGNEKKGWLLWGALYCFLGFVGMTLYDLWNPMFVEQYDSIAHGYRGSCIIDVPLFGLLPLLTLFYLVRQAAPLNKGWLSVLITLGSFAPLVAVMQVTCMGGAVHNLVSHILPLLGVGIVVALLARKFF